MNISLPIDIPILTPKTTTVDSPKLIPTTNTSLNSSKIPTLNISKLTPTPTPVNSPS